MFFILNNIYYIILQCFCCFVWCLSQAVRSGAATSLFVSSNLTGTSICTLSSIGQSVWLRTRRLWVQLLQGAPINNKNYFLFSGCSLAWQSTWFGTKGSQVQILSSRPFWQSISVVRELGSYPRCREFESLLCHHRSYSSTGQSPRLIIGRLQVQVLLAPPFISI